MDIYVPRKGCVHARRQTHFCNAPLLGPDCKLKDSDGTKFNKIAASIGRNDYVQSSTNAFWMIDDPQRQLEESNTLSSDVFSFGCQNWRLLLHTVELPGVRYIDVALSRVTISSEPPSFSSVRWHAGILDRNGAWVYDRRGLTRLETACQEWMPVADWSGPEWEYMFQEKDLCIPGNRLTVAVQLMWNSKGFTSTVGRVETIECSQHFKEIVWRIVDPKQHLEECETLPSDNFDFETQTWRLLLQKIKSNDALYMKVSLSRINIFNMPILCPYVWWQLGVLDRNGLFHYDYSGWTKQETPCNEWTTVAESPTMMEWTYINKNKDLFMTENQLTNSIIFCCFGPLFVASKRMGLEKSAFTESNPKNRYIPGIACDVIFKVRDRIFCSHRKILKMFAPVLDAMLCTSETDGNIKDLHLPDCDPEAFEVFLSFAYSGELVGLTDDVIEKVYYIADRYDVVALKAECVQRLLTTLSADSVCRILGLAERHKNEELREKATVFFVTSAQDVFRTTEWLQFMVTHTNLANDLIIRSHEKATED